MKKSSSLDPKKTETAQRLAKKAFSHVKDVFDQNTQEDEYAKRYEKLLNLYFL